MLLTFDGSGQAYRKGFILTAQQDTVRGLIRYNETVGSAVPCYFKSGPKATVLTYSPEDIHGFRYDNDKYFISRSVGKSSDVFLEVLVKGYVSLYKFHDIYFIEKADSAFFELSDQSEELTVEGVQVRARTKNFTRMLMLLMSDCLQTSRMIQETPLKENPLIKLISVYNTCSGRRNSYFRKGSNR